MTYRGKVKGGVIVLEPGMSLPEGVDVRVEPTEDGCQSEASHFHPVGAWEGPPGELDQLLMQVQDLRHAGLAEEDFNRRG
jgi:hypothetical protein